jgi:fructose-bisphosphate aldolase class II
VASDTRIAITGTLRKYFAENPSHFDPRQYLKPARSNVKEVVRQKLREVLGCSGKAKDFI